MNTRKSKQAKIVTLTTAGGMSKPTVVVVTGATSGIGLALAQTYAKRPNHVVIGTCRNVSRAKELEASGCKAVELDVASDESCESFLQRLTDKCGVDKVDILINNAGIGHWDDTLGAPHLIKSALEQINTNALGPLRVTTALLPLLKKAAAESGRPVKVANISSRMGSIGDGNSGGAYGYRASKAAENMITVTLAADLEKDNILCLALHPGHIRTKMTDKHGDMDPLPCAERLLKIIDNATKDDCSKFHHRDGQTLPW
jgi:NAD(P)-dependent dehydrogenase (short-subunit alcohol dehydrogenase family)